LNGRESVGLYVTDVNNVALRDCNYSHNLLIRRLMAISCSNSTHDIQI